MTADESFFASVTNNTIPGNNPLEASKRFRSDYTEEIISRIAIMVINQTLRGFIPSAMANIWGLLLRLQIAPNLSQTENMLSNIIMSFILQAEKT